MTKPLNWCKGIMIHAQLAEPGPPVITWHDTIP